MTATANCFAIALAIVITLEMADDWFMKMAEKLERATKARDDEDRRP